MDGYLLSYNPNDFFWVSVQDEFDFAQCPLEGAVDISGDQNASGDASANPMMCPIAPVSTCPAAQSCPTVPSTEWQSAWGWTPTSMPTSSSNVSPGYLFNQLYMNPHNATPTPASNAELKGDFARELCNNYRKGNRLLNLQNEVSTTQVFFGDMSVKSNTQVRDILNICIGIVGIFIVGRLT